MISASYGPSWDNPGCVERPCWTGRTWQKKNLPASGRAARDGAVSRPSRVRMSTETGRFRPISAWWSWSGRAGFLLESLAKQISREFNHGLARRDLVAVLVLDHHVDQHPARFFARLLGLDDSKRLDGIAGPHRLDPAGLQAAVDGAGRIGPVGDHARDQPKIVHAVHDDAAEIGLAEIALHVVVVEMQRVVVERGIAKQADGFARHREFRPVDRIAGVEAFKCRRHGWLP